VQVLAVPAASPARGFSGPEVGNHERYRRLLRAIAEEHGIFCLNAQLCGFEGGKGFIGGSMVIDPFGQTLAEAPLLDDAYLSLEIDLATMAVARAQSPLLSDLQGSWPVLQRITASLQGG
jgi:predicted amidohydrolase